MRTSQRSAPGFHAKPMFSPIRRPSIFNMPPTVSLRFSNTGVAVCLRANASN